MRNGKLSRFGVFCRKIRLDNGELLYDMAERLGVSSAFLSKVENGKSKPPADWREKMISLYKMDQQSVKELDESLYEANNMQSIDMRAFSDEDKELMWSFARKLDSVDREKLKRLLNDKE